MAISPLVQQHQRSIVQQSTDSTQFAFNKEFGDAAYELLGSKFPRLLPYVITFKVIDQGEKEGDMGAAVGVFIISRAQDVGYIPVVMSDGSIVSCEMLYSKDDDELMPIIPKMVKHIVSENMTQEHTLVKNPSVENTRELYKNMFRPPMSSRPVIAGNTELVSQLPDDAKRALSKYFEEHPAMLAKVASFYPVEVLAEKLAVGAQTEKVANEKAVEKLGYLDKVIRLEDLTKEAASDLSSEAKTDVLEVGYAIVDSPEEPVEVLTETEVPTAAEQVLKAAEYNIQDKSFMGTGKLLRFNGSELVLERCIVSCNSILTKEASYYASSGTVVLCDFQEGLDKERVAEILPLKPLTEFRGGDHYNKVHILYPIRGGGFRVFNTDSNLQDIRNIDGTYWAYFDTYNNQAHCFSPDLKVGSVKYSEDSRVFPVKSYIFEAPRKRQLPAYYAVSIQDVTSLITRACPAIQIKKDGSDISLINRFTGTTTKHASEPELVNHLVENYQFDKKAADKLLTSKKVFMVKKAEMLPMGKEEYPSVTPLGSSGGHMLSQMEREDEPYMVDESVIEDMAEFEDPEMMDTALVGSLAHADDIKALLIDSNQTLSDAVTELGKAILLFSLNKGEMEEHYGREEYSAVAHNLRTGFTTLGGLTFSIKEYTNNVAYDRDEA